MEEVQEQIQGICEKISILECGVKESSRKIDNLETKMNTSLQQNDCGHNDRYIEITKSGFVWQAKCAKCGKILDAVEHVNNRFFSARRVYSMFK